MGMFSVDENEQFLTLEKENRELKEQIAQLKEELRLTKEGRSFFYKDAKAYHDMAMRLKQENSNLRARFATHTNPEDTYRDDFGGMFMDEAEIIREAFRRA